MPYLKLCTPIMNIFFYRSSLFDWIFKSYPGVFSLRSVHPGIKHGNILLVVDQCMGFWLDYIQFVSAFSQWELVLVIWSEGRLDWIHQWLFMQCHSHEQSAITCKYTYIQSKLCSSGLFTVIWAQVEYLLLCLHQLCSIFNGFNILFPFMLIGREF